MLIVDWGTGTVSDAALALRTLLAREGRFVLVSKAEAIDALRRSPATRRALSDAATLTEAGRAAEISFQWSLAETTYRRALEALDEALIRLHEPETVARLHLALGAVAIHQGQRARAQEEFRRALSLFPALTPDKSYNPQVRSAFEEARAAQPGGRETASGAGAPGPAPGVAEAGRLCGLVQADALVLVEEEPSPERRGVRASLFFAKKGAFVSVETRVFPGGTPTKADSEFLAARVLEGLGTLFPAPRPASVPASQTQPVKQPPPPPPPPPRLPWYKRWWVWAAIGSTVALSVSVPVLVLKRDTVGVVVPY